MRNGPFRRVGPLLQEDRGVALALTLVIILILAAIVLGTASVTTSEVEIERLSRWDTQTQYLAQAAAEHLIYLLKRDKPTDVTLAPVNFPVTTGQESWYFAAAICQSGCAADTRTWTITASGEMRRAGSGPPSVGSPCTDPCLQRRDLRIAVQIEYASANPIAVTLTRWEEIYP